MDTASVAAKARKLMEPALGAARTEEIIRLALAIEDVKDARDLLAHLGPPRR